MVDVNKPVENAELVKAIDDYKTSPSQAAQDALKGALLNANFLLVLEKPLHLDDIDENGLGVLKEKQQIGIRFLSDAQDNIYMFGFTDWRELTKWSQKQPAETPALIMPFSHMASMLLDERTNYSGFVVNPASHNLILSKHLVAEISGRPMPQTVTSYTVEKDTRVKLGVPSEYPTEVANALKAAAKPHNGIKRMFLLLMCKENGERSFLIVVDGKGDVRKMFPILGQAAGPLLPAGMFLDFVSANEPFGQRAIVNQKPFYKRGLF